MTTETELLKARIAELELSLQKVLNQKQITWSEKLLGIYAKYGYTEEVLANKLGVSINNVKDMLIPGNTPTKPVRILINLLYGELTFEEWTGKPKPVELVQSVDAETEKVKSTKKVFTKEHIANLSKAMSKPVSINTVIYTGISEAAKQLNLTRATVRWKVKSPMYVDWYYV
jgi:hypothetical protein